MPDNPYQLFSKKNKLEIEKAYEILKQKEAVYKDMEAQFKNHDSVIHLAKKSIEESLLEIEQKKTLSQAIDQLIFLLTKESDYQIMLSKYAALATMLQEVVVNTKNDAQMKIIAMDAFLQVMDKPSTKIINNVSTTFRIGALVLIIVLPLISYFIVTLIPFTAALALLGLSGELLIYSSLFLTTLTQFIASTVVGCMYQFLGDVMKESVAGICQWFSDEYSAAKEIKENLLLNFISADESPGEEPDGFMPSFT